MAKGKQTESTSTPRKEVIGYLEASIQRGLKISGKERPNFDWVSEIRRGTELGMDLYRTMEALYDEKFPNNNTKPTYGK